MQTCKINILKKVFRLIVLTTLLLTPSLFGADPIRIMPLGDSITRGDSGNSGSGYRGPLWSKLIAGGYNFDFVGSQTSGQAYDVLFDASHEGHNGDEADLIANDVNGYLSNNPADVILLHIGTNDLSPAGDQTDETVNDVENILINIDNYSTDIKVVLARVIDRNPHNAETTIFNTKLGIMAQQRIDNGDAILIIDMENGADINYTADMSDTLHPNDTGYAKMADLWYSALKTVIPMHLWKLDEPTGSTTYLDSGREANGTCIGVGCPVAIAGKIDGAQEFDSTDEINVIDTVTFNWATDDSFTIEFWMKTDTAATVGKNNIMIGQESNSNPTGLAWFIGIDDGTGKVLFGLNDSNDTGYTDSLGDNIIVSDNQWHHVACVRDGDNNTSKIYIDGTLDDTMNHTYDAPFNDGNQPVTIGYLNWNGFKYDGALDEIAIFDSALSAAQILQNYQAGQITITSTPVTFTEVNVAYSYDVNTNNDPDVTFGLNTYPTGMNINTGSGEIGWMPDADDVGNIDIEVEATDTSNGDTATQDYVLRVRNIAIFPSGMNHYWKLDEPTGSTTYLDSYLGADGTCIGLGCPMAITGQIDGAQEFDGSHEIDVTDTSTFNWAADDSFTIEFWMKTDTNNTGGKHNIMMGQQSNSNPTGLAWYIGVTSTTGKIRLGLNDSNDTGYTDSLGDNIIVSDNVWHHVACVRDGDNNTTKIYIDGTLDDTKVHTYDAPFNDGNQPVTFGYLNWGGFKYTGALDEIVIFDSALSQVEIQEHVTNGLNGIGFGADVVIPVITLIGANPQVIVVGDTYTELNATAQDDVDGNISANIVIDASAVTTNTIGEYTVTYDVNDSAGNAAVQVTRTVNVVDATLPVITLLGSTPIDVARGSTYTDAGATASDDIDGNITGDIVIVNPVDTNTLGQYTVTYDVNDSAGNAAVQVTRTVNVVDDTLPVITLLGSTPIDVAQESTYTDAGATASDDIDGNITGDIVIVNPVDTNTLGQYTVTYDVNDSTGNAAVQVTRTVNVVDKTAPIVSEITAVTTPTSDTTPNYIFSSNEAGTITYGGSCSSATTTATDGFNVITFNALADGTYNDCTITVTDAASNASDPLAVTEFVIEATGGESNGGGGGCTYNPNSNNFDMSFLLMIALGLFYPFRRKYLKESLI